MPEGAISVARPSRWGNPFKVGDPHPVFGWPMSRAEVVSMFRAIVAPHALLIRSMDDGLRGHDLACYCQLTEPCHGDVWLELANA